MSVGVSSRRDDDFVVCFAIDAPIDDKCFSYLFDRFYGHSEGECDTGLSEDFFKYSDDVCPII